MKHSLKKDECQPTGDGSSGRGLVSYKMANQGLNPAERDADI